MSTLLAEENAQVSSSDSSSYMSNETPKSPVEPLKSSKANLLDSSIENINQKPKRTDAATPGSAMPAGLSYMKKNDGPREKLQFTPNVHIDAESENRFPVHTLQSKGRPLHQQPTPQQITVGTSGIPNRSSSPKTFTTSITPAKEWASKLAQTFLPCSNCGKISTDVVQVLPGPHLACRTCSSTVATAVRGAGANSATVQELPPCLNALIEEVMRCSGRGATPVGSGKVMPTTTVTTTTTTTSAAATTTVSSVDDSIMGRRKVHVKRNFPTSSSASGITSPTGKQRDGSDASGAPRDAALLLEQLDKAELSERHQIEAAENKAFEVLRKGRKTPGVVTSRQLKVSADAKYENGEYTAAVELYSKAIQMQPMDCLTSLKMLYGNRSAAQFMTQRFRECVDDCLKVVQIDPSSISMIERAAKAAATMGDLDRAVSILDMIPADKVSNTARSNRAKYKDSLEYFNKAEKKFGTSEGDECYRILVAQFSDNVHFRIRFAESLMQQKHYLRAVETLEALSTSHRPPKACRIMSECLYLSGFEYFERARQYIRDAACFDEECEKLLQLIDVVDEGKQKGNSNFARKNFAEAVAHYANAIEKATNNDQILRILYCNRAAANKELARYREGIEDCTKALSIDPDFFKAYARRGRCHYSLSDNFSAVKDFRKALEFDPHDSELAKELRDSENALAKEAEKEKDFYYQLGVTRTSTDRDIKLKFRELSLRWHPDKCVGLDEIEKERAEHKFKVINEAYGTLTDPEKRRAYDLKFDREQRLKRGGGGGGFGFASTYSSNDYFRGQTRTRAGPGGFW